jgi:FlaA1/EpsC-like NDP-sugar epimerase
MMDVGSLFFDPELTKLATGRDASLFAEDMSAHSSRLEAAIAGRRVLVTGGAGSIGASTAELLLGFKPAAVHVIDIAENALVELVRDVRSRAKPLVRGELRLLPIDYGSAATERLLQSEPPYDFVLHFAAHKHVRSEKDVPSLLQMLDTNVVKMRRFLRWLARYGHGTRFFAVSTDKAANPTSLMGASKRLMEHVLFTSGGLGTVTSARFANVAFSNGSLLQGFLFRLARRQPLAVPREVRRYFVSAREAAEICLLGALVAPTAHIVFPRLDASEHLRPLVEMAQDLLKRVDLRPSLYDDETRACAAVADELKRGHYPVLVTPLDTSGEKPYEEFVAVDEVMTEVGFSALQAVRYVSSPGPLDDVLSFIDRAVNDADLAVTKSDITKRLASVVPGFRHVEAGRSLDERA